MWPWRWWWGSNDTKRRKVHPPAHTRPTGRGWAIDVDTRRIVGSRWTLAVPWPWWPVSVTVATGALSTGSKRSRRMVYEDEVAVRDSRGRKRRMFRCNGGDGDGDGDGDCDGDDKGDEPTPHTTRNGVLYASMQRIGAAARPIDVTRLVNARVFPRDGIGLADLVAVMAAHTGSEALEDMVDDPHAMLLIVLPDLREVTFEHGERVTFSAITSN